MSPAKRVRAAIEAVLGPARLDSETPPSFSAFRLGDREFQEAQPGRLASYRKTIDEAEQLFVTRFLEDYAHEAGQSVLVWRWPPRLQKTPRDGYAFAARFYFEAA